MNNYRAMHDRAGPTEAVLPDILNVELFTISGIGSCAGWFLLLIHFRWSLVFSIDEHSAMVDITSVKRSVRMWDYELTAESLKRRNS